MVMKQETNPNLMNQVAAAIGLADEQAALKRVAQLREKYPLVEPAALVGMLIKQKCLQAGAVGEVASSASVIPGVGVFVSMLFGQAADLGLTAKMQAELVLEIAAAYNQQISEADKQSALVMVTGLSAEATQLLAQTGQEIAQQATAQLAHRPTIKAIPTLGVAATAGANLLSTYLVGRQADLYFRQGPASVQAGGEPAEPITGLDQQQLVDWLTETTERSWHLLDQSAQTAKGAVIVAGQSLGEVVVLSSDKTQRAVAGAGREVARSAGFAAGIAVEAGKTTKAGLDAGLEKAGEMAAGAGHSAVWGVGFAAGVVTDVGRWVGRGVAAGAGKVGDLFARQKRP